MEVICLHPVQEGDDLGAGAGCADTEGAVAHAGGDAVLNGPGHGGIVPCAGLDIGEADGGGGGRLAGCCVQEGHDLLAGALGIGIKVGSIRTGGNAILGSPQHCLVEVIGLGHVHEGIAGGDRLGLTGSCVQEGHRLGAGDIHVGAEGGGGGAGGEAVLDRPQDIVDVPAVLGNVHKGVVPGCIAADTAGALPLVTQGGSLVGNVAVAALAGVGGVAGLGAGGAVITTS